MSGIAAALIGGAISAGTALAGTAMRNEAQKRENKLAFEREKQQIREQNSYNSPSAQMARLASAGLNPNLMYEQAEAGLQTDTAHYTPAELEGGVEPLGNVGSQMISDMVGLKDLQNKTLLAESQVLLNSSTIGVNTSEVTKNEALVDIMYQEMGLKRQELDGKLREIDSKISYNDAAAKELAQRVNESLSRMEVNKETIAKMTTEQKVMLALLPSQIALNNASAEQAWQYAFEAYEKARTVAAYYHLEDAKFDLEQMKFDWDKTSFYSHQDFMYEQNRKDRTLSYINLGVNTALDVAGMAYPAFGMGRSFGQVFSRSPWAGYGSSTATYGQAWNSPSKPSPKVKAPTGNRKSR